VSGVPSVAGACLVVAALLAAWPVESRRARRARLLNSDPAAPVGRVAHVRSVLAHVDASPRLAILLTAGAAGAAGATVAGPVAAIAVGAYAALATHGCLRGRRARRETALRVRRLDELGALAADLRAGLPLPVVGGFSDASASSPKDGAVDRLTELTDAARRLADETGAPLADLLDRIEGDARAADRARAAAVAQAAGARVTALLLAALPVAGIGLGYGMGFDPLAVLLHTSLGAVCAVTAIALQVAGLAWSQRLIRVAP
jgi:tight adherence protein B